MLEGGEKGIQLRQRRALCGLQLLHRRHHPPSEFALQGDGRTNAGKLFQVGQRNVVNERVAVKSFNFGYEQPNRVQQPESFNARFWVDANDSLIEERVWACSLGDSEASGKG